ncbi:protein SHORT ROOT IN SALT MEDIUM 1-like [Capsicum annuum]|uniref:protein SHORT ROOT IN SALT MEDIUM 1-like n=1 Tax=Capsicum annuum TaxID=4072 RepID=UPI001FB0B851|nr:protein SHORT ROOT IN SALT MEDIUM 1-like [Capsicum annuum]
MYEQVIPGSVDHFIPAVDDEPEDDIEEHLEEDPEKDLEDMEGDPEEKPEEDPEEDPKEDPKEDSMEEQEGELTEEMKEDPEEEEYGPIDFSGGEDEDHQGQQSNRSPEYHPGPYYDLDNDDDDPPQLALGPISVSDS